MVRFFCAAVCFTVITFHCNAQSDLPPAKKFNHYVGIQANELLRQLFNFSNTNTTIVNPFTVVYSISPTNSKWGGHAGFGYTYSWIEDKSNSVGRVSKVNDVTFRLGIERKIPLGKRFEAGMAFDIVGGYEYDRTSSVSVTNLFSAIDSSFTEVTNKTTSIGAGPQFSIGYHISERFMLGTESTLYYISQNLKENIIITDKLTQLFSGEEQISVSNSNSEIDMNKFNITLPVALFLIIKF